MNNLNPPTINQSFSQIQIILEKIKPRTINNSEIREAIYHSRELIKDTQPKPEIQVILQVLNKSLDALHRLEYVSKKDFFARYFEALEDFENPKKAFNSVNDYYWKSFGERKYKNFKAFKDALIMS